MAAPTLMVTISGIRGIVGDSLTPRVVEKYVAAFASLQKGTRIVLGRDSRVSGPWVYHITVGTLMAMGYEVIDVGIVPTPTVQVLVGDLKACGGVIITSSHNPVEWNGLKFVDRDTLFLAPNLCEEMFALADSGAYKFSSYERMGFVAPFATASERHIELILQLPYLNIATVAARKFRVCLDAINGAGGPIMKALLEKFGCEVIGLNLEPTGLFAHKPEPLPENLGDLCEAVRQHKADLGIAVDPDTDRCVLIDETGSPLGEEYTLALAVKFFLEHTGRRGPVCKNLASSLATDAIAKTYGCETFSSAVGEINVAVLMKEKNAIIGGEGNGGIMLPDIHIGRDAPVAAALTLQHLALFSGPISALKASLPQYEIVKLKAPLSGLDPDYAISYMRAKWANNPDVTLDERDGLKIEGKDWWILFRKSNTEPIIRVIGEERTKEGAQKRCEEFLAEIIALSKPSSS